MAKQKKIPPNRNGASRGSSSGRTKTRPGLQSSSVRLLIAAAIIAVAAALLLTLPTADSPPVRDASLEARITNVLELATYEQRYREIIYYGEEQRVLFFRTSDKEVLFGIDVLVRAGLDLSHGVEVFRDRTNRDRLLVRIPEPEILSIDARETSIEQYFVSERRGEIGMLEMADRIADTKDEVRSRALESGLLARAESNAREVVDNLFGMLGFSDVQVSVRNRGLEL